MLPPKAIAEFKKLYETRYGVRLSDAEASRRANGLVNFYKAILKPAPKLSNPPTKKSANPPTRDNEAKSSRR